MGFSRYFPQGRCLSLMLVAWKSVCSEVLSSSLSHTTCLFHFAYVVQHSYEETYSKWKLCNLFVKCITKLHEKDCLVRKYSLEIVLHRLQHASNTAWTEKCFWTKYSVVMFMLAVSIHLLGFAWTDLCSVHILPYAVVWDRCHAWFKPMKSVCVSVCEKYFRILYKQE